MIEAAIFVVFPFCMAYAAVSDLLSMTIANRVSLLLVAAFLVLAALTGMGWEAIGWHLVAGAAVLAVTFALFAMGTMGGGDAKLMSATAVWMGLAMPLVEYLFYSSLAGGLMTLLILLYRRSPLAPITVDNLFLRHFADEKEGVPYGIALGIGGLCAFPGTALAGWAMAKLAAG